MDSSDDWLSVYIELDLVDYGKIKPSGRKKMLKKILSLPRSLRRKSFLPIADSGSALTENIKVRLEAIEKKLDGYNLEYNLTQSYLEHNLARSFSRHFVCYYNKSENSYLNELCDIHGSDKGEVRSEGHPYSWRPHTFADFYERQFSNIRDHVRNVFECGLGTNNLDIASNMGINAKPGASLRVWRDYFSNAHIYGADIDRDILFEEDRISTFYCDQTDPNSISKMWKEMENVEFDIMIDDGLHTFEAGICLFENSFWKLKHGGTYIIEDVNINTLISFDRWLSKEKISFEFICMYRDSLALGMNSMVVIRK